MTRQLWSLGLTSLAALAGLAAPARAQIVVRAPFVRVQVGPGGGVNVWTPWANVQAPRPVVVSAVGAPTIVIPGTNRVMPSAETAPPPARIGDPIPVPIPQPGQTDFSVPVPIPKPGQTDFSVPVPNPMGRALTHREFATVFKPSAGTHEVTLMHPATNRPVAVQFTLPEGQPQSVRTLPRRVTFDYGRTSVVILFLNDGSVRVTN